MNKVYGQINSYSPIRDDRSRIVVCYGKEDIDATNAIWYEMIRLPIALRK